MEGFISILDPVKDVQRFLFAGGDHLNRLKTPFQGTVLLNGPPEFIRRSGSETLDLTSGQSWFENVGGIQGAFRRSRPHQGVEFINEDDEVGVLHELLDDGFESLFELSTVLGTGYDQRDIEGQQPLVTEHGGNIPIHNLLGQPFDDGRLSDTRLSNQDRIVLGPATQDLNDSFHFGLPPDQWIQGSRNCRIGQIAAELGQDQPLLGLARDSPFGQVARQFVADLGNPKAFLVEKRGCDRLFFAKQTEQYVFRTDVIGKQPLGLFVGVAENLFGFVTEGQFNRGRDLVLNAGPALDFFTNSVYGCIGSWKEATGERLVFAKKSQQDVFGLDAART